MGEHALYSLHDCPMHPLYKLVQLGGLWHYIFDSNTLGVVVFFELPSIFTTVACATVGFHAGQCDCRLLLTTPGDHSTAEGEDESGCGSSVHSVACLIRVCVSFKSNRCI